MTESSYDAVAKLEEVPNLLPTADVEPNGLTFRVAHKRLSSQAALGTSLKFLVFDQDRQVQVEEPFGKPHLHAPAWPRYGDPPWRLDVYEGPAWKRRVLPAGKYSGVALIDGRRSRFVHFGATESGFPTQPSVTLDFFSARPLEARWGQAREPDLLLRTQYPPNQEALEEENVSTPFCDACVLELDGREYPREIPNLLMDMIYSVGTGNVMLYWASLDEFHIPYVPGEHRVSVSLKDLSDRVFARSEEQLIQF